MPTPLKSCVACKASKVKCDALAMPPGQKCTRCARLGLRCEQAKASPRTKRGASVGDVPQARANGEEVDASIAYLKSILSSGGETSPPESLVYMLRFHAAMARSRGSFDGMSGVLRACSALGVPLQQVLSLPKAMPPPEGPLELPGQSEAMLGHPGSYVHVRHLRDGCPHLRSNFAWESAILPMAETISSFEGTTPLCPLERALHAEDRPLALQLLVSVPLLAAGTEYALQLPVPIRLFDRCSQTYRLCQLLSRMSLSPDGRSWTYTVGLIPLSHLAVPHAPPALPVLAQAAPQPAGVAEPAAAAAPLGAAPFAPGGAALGGWAPAAVFAYGFTPVSADEDADASADSEAAAAALLFDDNAAVFADAERLPSPLGEACLPPIGPSALDEGLLAPPTPPPMSIDVSATQPAEPAAAGEPLLLRELLSEVASSAVDPCARQLGPEAIESCFDVLSTEAIALVTLHGLEEGPVRPKFERVSRPVIETWCDWFPGAREIVHEATEAGRRRGVNPLDDSALAALADRLFESVVLAAIGDTVAHDMLDLATHGATASQTVYNGKRIGVKAVETSVPGCFFVHFPVEADEEASLQSLAQSTSTPPFSVSTPPSPPAPAWPAPPVSCFEALPSPSRRTAEGGSPGGGGHLLNVWGELLEPVGRHGASRLPFLLCREGHIPARSLAAAMGVGAGQFLYLGPILLASGTPHAVRSAEAGQAWAEYASDGLTAAQVVALCAARLLHGAARLLHGHSIAIAVRTYVPALVFVGANIACSVKSEAPYPRTLRNLELFRLATLCVAALSRARSSSHLPSPFLRVVAWLLPTLSAAIAAASVALTSRAKPASPREVVRFVLCGESALRILILLASLLLLPDAGTRLSDVPSALPSNGDGTGDISALEELVFCCGCVLASAYVWTAVEACASALRPSRRRLSRCLSRTEAGSHRQQQRQHV